MDAFSTGACLFAFIEGCKCSVAAPIMHSCHELTAHTAVAPATAGEKKKKAAPKPKAAGVKKAAPKKAKADKPKKAGEHTLLELAPMRVLLLRPMRGSTHDAWLSTSTAV